MILTAIPTISRRGVGELTFDGTGFLGTGLFAGTWGFAEWMLIGFGAWLLFSGPEKPSEKRGGGFAPGPERLPRRRSRRKY